MIFILLFFFELNLMCLKKKILDNKNFFEIDYKDCTVLLISILIVNLFDINLITAYVIFRFFDYIVTIYLRMVLLNVFYKFFFDKNAKEKHYLQYPIQYTFFIFFFKKIFKYEIISMLLILINFKLWLVYWVISEFFAILITQLELEFDQAIFGKNMGHDIQITFSGFLKLVAYKKYILDNRGNFFAFLKNEGVIVDINDYGLYLGKDYWYSDPKIQFLASLD